MRRRFFWAIFGVSTILSVLVVGAAVGAVNDVRNRATGAELERAGRAVGQVLTDRIGRPGVMAALRNGDLTIPEVAGDVASLVAVAGGAEIEVFAVGPAGVVGRDVPDVGVDLDGLRAGDSQLVEVPGEPPTFVYATPVARLPERDLVLVAVLVRDAPVMVEAPQGLTIIAVGLAAVLAAVAARVLSGRLTRQLDSVAAAAERVSAGDFEARADEGGATEIDTVARSFNSMAEAMAASRERERQFLLSVGHDLRTPLTTITGYVEALEDGVDDDEEVRRIAGVMSTEGRRLRRLIEDVMLLARLESSDFGLRPEPVEVDGHLDSVLAPFRDRAGEVRVAWHQELEVPGERIVDPDRLGQIVGNLVENALRHTPETGSVSVGAHLVDGGIEVVVADSGPGIDPEDRDRIFDRFYVARRYRGVRPEGSGLGLSIVDRLVRAMDGTVELGDGASGGSSFRVWLPAPPA